MAARKKSKPKNITAKMQTSQSSQSEPRANIKTAAEFARTLTRRLETEFPTIESKIKSYTQQDLENIANSPEQYQKQLVELSNYMYRRSGYFKRIADYFVDMALYCWTVDTEVLDEAFYDIETAVLSKNFTSFTGAVSKLNIEKELHDIFIRVFLEDACFAYFIETETGAFLYYLPSNWCSLRKTYSGVNIYGIDPKAVPDSDAEKLPGEIQALLK